ncbi:MAG: restriction endonuclease subunit S [Bacteroidetes bacterium]|nr:restriction endonuclease subunit S [Bacteroidota bacterium]
MYKYTFGAFMGCFRTTNPNFDPYFIYLNFQSFNYRSFIDVLLSGSSINNLKSSDIESIGISVPNLIIQKNISSIIRDMDNELAILKNKLQRIVLIKQGMLQSLLTGKIRLKMHKLFFAPVSSGELYQNYIRTVVTGMATKEFEKYVCIL